VAPRQITLGTTAAKILASPLIDAGDFETEEVLDLGIISGADTERWSDALREDENGNAAPGSDSSQVVAPAKGRVAGKPLPKVR
jgi:hypothetical protein